MNFAEKIIDWYLHNKRDLPWRKTNDPYKIWISEIILQQTRVQQGLPYYNNFIKLFPDVFALANADEQSVLKAWQGLGYYSRARNLHFTSKQIAGERFGEFPTNFDELRKLKGIGDYTASAIASIAFNQPVASVDGNVFRVLSRILCSEEVFVTSSGKKFFQQQADKLISKEFPAYFNQGMMELGATICLPASPDCHNCPALNFCVAYKQQKVSLLPTRVKKINKKIRFFTYFILKYDDGIILKRRILNDIWKHLYEFPLIETPEATQPGNAIKLIKLPLEKPEFISEWEKYILTHQQIQIRFITFNLEKELSIPGTEMIKYKDLNNIPFPRPIAQIIDLLKKKTGIFN